MLVETATEAVGGADPLPEFRLSQLRPSAVEPVALQASVPEPMLLMVSACEGGSAMPCSPAKPRVAGAIERVGGNWGAWMVTAFDVARFDVTPPPLALPLKVTVPAALAE